VRKKVKNEIYPEGKEILETRKVRKGSEEVALIDEMDPEEGKLIDRAFRAVKRLAPSKLASPLVFLPSTPAMP
jgi:hypothetical protein